MKINIQNININYIQYGEGKDILLLHGWGQNIEMMRPIGDNLCERFRITILDLPGFGASDEPESAWTIEKYSNMLEKFVKLTGIKKPVVIGHSFGGRVAIRYCSRNPIEKLILFGSPCIRIEENLSFTVKFLKKEPLVELPETTMLGALTHYISYEAQEHFQPVNSNWGIINKDGIDRKILKNKKLKTEFMSKRAKDTLSELLKTI